MLPNSLNIYRTYTHMAKKSLGFIGVPFCKGQGKQGVEVAPDELRKGGLLSFLNKQEKLQFKDYGNLIYKHANHIDAFNNMKNCSDFIGCSVALINEVKKILRENDMYATIGGDHAIGFGSVAGHLLANPNTSLIWIDAHADINVSTTSKSGNIHGMPVAFLINELRHHWTGLDLGKIAPICVPVKEIVYIGLRDVDPHEAYILHKLGVTYFAMDAIDKFGVSKITEMTLDKLNPNNSLHVSFDIDALDVSFAPSTGTPVLGGLTLRESLFIMETLWNTNRIQGFDLVEINPQIGTETDVFTTLQAALQIFKALCGYKRSEMKEDKIVNLFKNHKNV